jgi:bifunctional ADP-heptose synthase (sugar kinase/adenylyltransferase)
VAILQKEVTNADIIILSDYAKGVLTPGIISSVCSLARAQGKRVIAAGYFLRHQHQQSVTFFSAEPSAVQGLEFEVHN